ncbi:hypothetical protein HpBT153_04960 [Helicobacter pylori]
MHVKTRRKLNFRKEKHKTDHDYHGVNVACNTIILNHKSLRVVSSWGCLVFTLFVIVIITLITLILA